MDMCRDGATNDADSLRSWLEFEVKGKLAVIDDKLDKVLLSVDGANFLSISKSPLKICEVSNIGESCDKEDKPVRRATLCPAFQVGGASDVAPEHHVPEQQDNLDQSSSGNQIAVAPFAKNTRSGTFSSAESVLSMTSGISEAGKAFIEAKNPKIHLRHPDIQGTMSKNFLRRNRWEKLWNCLEDSESSALANLYATIMPGLVLLSVILTLLQTSEPPLIHGWGAATAETAFETIFIFEFVVRFAACPNRSVFMASPFNVIDLLAGAVLIFRICQGLNLDRCSSAVRTMFFVTVPILRMTKSLRRFRQLHLIRKAFANAAEALPVLIVTLVFIVLLFSSLIYLVEPRDNIDTLPKAMWLTIVTMTTVGYGDVSPVSTAGYLVTAVLIILSVLYMAMPIGIVGQTFGWVWQERGHLLLIQHTQKRLKQYGYTAEDIPVIFHLFDEDVGGELELSEFRKMVIEMGLGMQEERIAELFEILDTDSGGGIDAREFVKQIFPSAFHRLYKLDAAHVRGRKLSDLYVPISEPETAADLRKQYTLSATARRTFGDRISHVHRSGNRGRLVSVASSELDDDSQAFSDARSVPTGSPLANKGFLHRPGTTLLEEVRQIRARRASEISHNHTRESLDAVDVRKSSTSSSTEINPFSPSST